MTKSKKLNLAKSKNSELTKAKNLDFVIVQSFRIDFLFLKAKKTFIYLQKTFIKGLIFKHFNLEHHICIETDTLGYIISGILSQITLNYSFSGHVTQRHSTIPSFKSISMFG